MYLDFKKAIEKNPEEVQCIQFTEDIKKQLIIGSCGYITKMSSFW